MSAIKLGFLAELSDNGILPSEFEDFMKCADGVPVISQILSTGGQLAGLSLAGGALLGGYSGLLRHKAEQAIEGKNDPDLVKVDNQLNMYRELISDLRRTDAVGRPA